MKYLAIVPCRSGSKGLPNKNIKNFLGKPLFYHSCNNAQNSKYINNIFFTTDSNNYLKLYQDFDFEKDITNNYLRPNSISTDKATTVDVILHLLEYLSKNSVYPENLVLMQATTPLIPVKILDNMIEYYEKHPEFYSLICGNTPIDNPYDCFYRDDDKIKRIGCDFSVRNRQEHPEAIKINGGIYIVSRINFMKYKSFLSEKTEFFQIQRKYSIDIDDEENFELAEIIGKSLNDSSTYI